MRFWITKSSELSIREQLVRQVILAIVSQDLEPGHKLPSIRTMARRFHIHSNTVSAAYHDLLSQGWLELRRGSGVYVRVPASDSSSGQVDALLKEMLRNAASKGHEPEAVLFRLQQLVFPRKYTRMVVVEADAGMHEILHFELSAHLSIPLEMLKASELAGVADLSSCLVAALPSRAATVRALLPAGIPLLLFRLRSVRESLETESRPTADMTIGIASRSTEFRDWARTVLIAVGLEPDSLCEIDTSLDQWQERASASQLLIADVVAANALPVGHTAKVFRVIADSCIAEIQQMFGN